MDKQRVVITGLGVVSPNGIGLKAFLDALKMGKSGIKFNETLQALKFSCQISGTPDITQAIINTHLTELEQRNFNSTGILYGLIAGLEAYRDAGLEPANAENPDWDSGTIFGSGTSGIDKFRESIYKIDDLKTRQLGSTSVVQTMNSGISAYLSQKLGLGNQVTTNSSACATGTESILMGFERIQAGRAKRLLVGSTSDSGPYIWGGFDAMRVCTSKHNQTPEQGSRPMSATASGFVPSSGAGAMVLESLASALSRNAPIYAEVLGGCVNSGGQRGLGSMTAPNPEAVKKCITGALHQANLKPQAIDYINGHLTATSKDSLEIKNWTEALGLREQDFPYINSLKSMIGHPLAACGSIESVATILQLKHNFVFPNINLEDLHPEISTLIDAKKIPTTIINTPIRHAIKASFGFGDVNACVVFKKFE